jgi:hypothetical protein
MYKYILTCGALDKSISFGPVEPLDDTTFLHELLLTNDPSRRFYAKKNENGHQYMAENGVLNKQILCDLVRMSMITKGELGKSFAQICLSVSETME